MNRRLLSAQVAREQAERSLVAAERRGDLAGASSARLDMDRLSKRIFWLETMGRIEEFELLPPNVHPIF